MEDRLLTVNEVGKRLGYCTTVIYRKTKSGEIPSLRMGTRIRYRESDIAKLIKVGTK